ncbi:AMP-binding protein [Phytohabitans sp. ZYX-F-186]|uniref:AMP-binding protein n=1 Tax=Phytohabitans maris TaxID=3071409 RepID=A0ABU0ZVK9_9ACTN|nr:AMP-binding protein [Phytohabitans sp. ZYX-F-186]MDQ7910836.1 AMP-binding protein [Phytohabitans sp. ZYX-F-186]
MTPHTPLARSLWEAESLDGIEPHTLSGLLRSAAQAHPDVLAQVDFEDRRQWTYARLDADVTRLARRLRHTFARGERVAVWMPNCPEFVLLQCALARAGLILVPVNPAYREKELAYVLDQSAAAGVFYSRSYRGTDMHAILGRAGADAPTVRHRIAVDEWDAYLGGEAAEDGDPVVAPADPVQILYTSGTTGVPKGAVLSNQAITHSMITVAGNAGLKAGDVWINTMPMFHIGGLGHGTIAAISYGGTQVIMQRFETGKVMAAIETHGGTSLLLVPTMIIDILDHPQRHRYDLSTLRSVMVGGAPVTVALAQRVERELGVPLFNLFGQTETSGPIAQTRPTDSLRYRTETVGRPQRYVSVRVVDPAGEVVPVGATGEIQARGRQVMSGYWDMAEATGRTLSDDGWLATGDVGSMDERGYLTVRSRLKDMIIRGGENIYPREIEEVLVAHPAVTGAAVVGLPDERWGEQVAAVLTADPAAVDAQALHDYVRAHLAPHKTPKRWFVTDVLPCTPSGKIQKFVVVERLRAGEFREL